MVINFAIESLKQDMRYINDLIGYEGIGACEEAALQLVERMESLLETTTNEKVANFILSARRLPLLKREMNRRNKYN